jgi:hypothetical protein
MVRSMAPSSCLMCRVNLQDLGGGGEARGSGSSSNSSKAVRKKSPLSIASGGSCAHLHLIAIGNRSLHRSLASRDHAAKVGDNNSLRPKARMPLADDPRLLLFNTNRTFRAPSPQTARSSMTRFPSQERLEASPAQIEVSRPSSHIRTGPFSTTVGSVSDASGFQAHHP